MGCDVDGDTIRAASSLRDTIRAVLAVPPPTAGGRMSAKGVEATSKPMRSELPVPRRQASLESQHRSRRGSDECEEGGWQVANVGGRRSRADRVRSRPTGMSQGHCGAWIPPFSGAPLFCPKRAGGTEAQVAALDDPLRRPPRRPPDDGLRGRPARPRAQREASPLRHPPRALDGRREARLCAGVR